jgi:putative ABC transport system permease protein
VRIAEYSRWSNLGEPKSAEVAATARRLRTAARAFSDFPVAARAVVLGDSTAQEFLLNLRESDLGRLDAQLHQLGVRAPLGGFSALRRLIVEELPELRGFMQAAQAGQRRAIDDLSLSFAGKSLSEVLLHSAPGELERFRAVGFELNAQDLAELSRLVSRTVDIASLNRLLQNGEVSMDIGRLTSVEASLVNFETVSEYVTSLNRAQAVVSRLFRAGVPSNINADRLLELANTHRHDVMLARALGDQDIEEHLGWFGLSERNQWLVVLSFLVCVVGVANAMLMSVTERFTEIATMKCLGAMDGFVMLMFVFEAIVQGVVGGIIGSLLGVLLAAVRAAVQYGSLLASATGVVGPVGMAMVVSLVVGVVLAAVAAVGPAWLAARLSPMEAMRVE